MSPLCPCVYKANRPIHSDQIRPTDCSNPMVTPLYFIPSARKWHSPSVVFMTFLRNGTHESRFGWKLAICDSPSPPTCSHPPPLCQSGLQSDREGLGWPINVCSHNQCYTCGGCCLTFEKWHTIGLAIRDSRFAIRDLRFALVFCRLPYTCNTLTPCTWSFTLHALAAN